MDNLNYLALDIYGTVLSTCDHNNSFPPRRGLEKLFDECDKSNIKIISASDGVISYVQCDLENVGVDISRFFDFMRFVKTPKEFGLILRKYHVNPEELLIIGDTYEKDIQGAINIGARYVHVLAYNLITDSFDISSVLNQHEEISIKP